MHIMQYTEKHSTSLDYLICCIIFSRKIPYIFVFYRQGDERPLAYGPDHAIWVYSTTGTS